MYWLMRFGTVNLPSSRPSHDIGAGQVDVRFPEMQGGGLFDSLGSGQAVLRGMAISWQGAALTQAQFTALRGMFGKRDKLYRKRDDGQYEWAYARMMRLDAPRTTENWNYIDVTAAFELLSAHWSGERHGDGWLLDEGEYIDAGLALDEASGDSYKLYAATVNLVINNAGNTPVKDAILTITAFNVAITGLTITKSSETHLVYAGTISPGNSLVIDCGAWSVKNDGVDDYANFSFGGSHATDEILVLDPGDNTIQVVKTGGNINDTLAIEFSDGWI